MDEVLTIFKQPDEPSYNWLIEQTRKPEHSMMKIQCEKIKKNFLRSHAVDMRATETYTFGGKTIVPDVVNVNLLPTIETFHTSFTVGDPVTLTGAEDAVELFSRYYGNLHRADYLICKSLIKYGNAYTYTYRDGDEIYEKVFDPCESTPIYDAYGRMIAFVERVENNNKADIIDTIFLPTHIDTYHNGRLIDYAVNTTGMLPCHIKSIEPWHYNIYGDSFMLNLISILDKEEQILSKTSEAVYKLSLSPILAITGATMVASDSLLATTGSSGIVLSLEDSADAKWINANIDSSTISMLLKTLEQNFCMVAGVPSSIIGQSNSSNLSAESVSQLYQLTENRAKQTIIAMTSGFKHRWKAMRELLKQIGEPEISNESFRSLQAKFNLTKPIDILNELNAIKTQYDMNAISERSVVELSPMTANVAQEIDRLSQEKDITPAE